MDSSPETMRLPRRFQVFVHAAQANNWDAAFVSGTIFETAHAVSCAFPYIRCVFLWWTSPQARWTLVPRPNDHDSIGTPGGAYSFSEEYPHSAYGQRLRHLGSF